MAGAYVQSWTANDGDSLIDTLTVTIGTDATAGNTLVAMLTITAGGDSLDAVTGWEPRYTNTSANNQAYAVYDRIASGDANDNFTQSWTDTGRCSIVVQEFSGLDGTAPFEDSDIDTTNSESDVTTQGCGTATPVTSNGIAITGWHANNEEGCTAANVTVPSGFTNLASTSATGTNRPIQFMTSKAYTTTAGQSPSWSTSDGGTDGVGTVLVYKEAAGAGGTTLTPSGIASAEAFGSGAASPGSVAIAPSGLASGEAHGTTTLSLSMLAQSIASAAAFGSATLSPGAVSVIADAIASAEAFGSLTVSNGATTVVPGAIASGETFGTVSISVGTVAISLSGIASAEAFGSSTVLSDALIPTGIASGETFGVQALGLTVLPGAISSGEAHGSASLSQFLAIIPGGIESVETFGTTVLLPGSVVIEVSGIASDSAFGTAVILGGEALGYLLAEIDLYAALAGNVDIEAALRGDVEVVVAIDGRVRLDG